MLIDEKALAVAIKKVFGTMTCVNQTIELIEAYESAKADNQQGDDLREKLIEAISLDQGWEESAVHMVDNVILPILRQHQPTAPDVSIKSTLDKTNCIKQRSDNFIQTALDKDNFVEFKTSDYGIVDGKIIEKGDKLEYEDGVLKITKKQQDKEKMIERMAAAMRQAVWTADLLDYAQAAYDAMMGDK